MDQLIVERMSVEVTCFDAFFQSLNSPRQMRREFSVAQDAERGFDVASGVRWSCSAWSIAMFTGSPSNAMLSATLRGMRAQRRRRFSSGGSARQFMIACFQVMYEIISFAIGMFKREPLRQLVHFLNSQNGFAPAAAQPSAATARGARLPTW
ncbi:MAG: hypothetical protein H0V34_00035 [Gammaproteobacteria bacterium]|nr:hypothetical protein [Gammaproteobacteria bacterium]